MSKSLLKYTKRVLRILAVLIFSQSFGQVEHDSIQKKSELIEFSVITEFCKDITDWTEKKDCSKQEMIKNIRRELNDEVIEKLTDKKYRIWYSFLFDNNGSLTQTTVITDNILLKKEFQRIIANLEFSIQLIDEKGKLRSGKFDFPIEILTEN